MFEAFLMSGQADPIDFLFKIISIQKTQINNTLSGIKLIYRRIAIILFKISNNEFFNCAISEFDYRL